ncbi:hypothetical protein [Pelagibacterium sp.]|uniref:hypothetical protein n=1 Tax=Pelagibacterium sp. TaxID=1967288 RepID=UPI003A900214
MTGLPIIFYWTFAFRGLFDPRQVLLWLLVLSLPFGSLAVVPPGLTAGLTLLPTSMTAVWLCVRVFFLRRNGTRELVTALFSYRSLGLLFLFWLYAIYVTLFAPRFFAGEIVVVPMRPSGFMTAELLRPTKQNISQMLYLTISVAMVLAIFQLFRRSKVRAVFPRIWLTGSMIVVGTGVLDLLSKFLPLKALLDPFRTASYAFLTEVEISGGAKRVVGLMPEASSYGSLCIVFLSILYFMIPAFPQTYLRRRASVVCCLLVVMTVLSTSSAAYVGLGVFLAFAALEWLHRNVLSGTAKVASLHKGAYAVMAILSAVALLFLFLPSFFDPMIARINMLIFEKVDTSSYLERSFWTRTAFEAGISSYFLGTGLGSVRGSNILATQFGSFGAPGCILYYLFVARLLWGRMPQHTDLQDAALVRAMRWSFWPPFCVALLVGTTPDFGVEGGLRWGILLALSVALPKTNLLNRAYWPLGFRVEKYSCPSYRERNFGMREPSKIVPFRGHSR